MGQEFHLAAAWPRGVPGWKLVKEYLSFDEVLNILNRRIKEPIQAKNWEELEMIENRFPVIEELCLMLANATSKTIWVTRVGGMQMEAWTEISVLRVTPYGSAVWTEC